MKPEDVTKVVDKMLEQEIDEEDPSDVDELFDIAENHIADAISAIDQAVRLSKNRLAQGQAEGYIIPHLRSWINDDDQIGSIPSLRKIIEEYATDDDDEEVEVGEPSEALTDLFSANKEAYESAVQNAIARLKELGEDPSRNMIADVKMDSLDTFFEEAGIEESDLDDELVSELEDKIFADAKKRASV